VVLRYNLWACLKRPIDGGATFRGRRLFGANKTWRGVVCAVAGCLATVAVQTYVVGDRAGSIAVLPYSKVNVVLLGLALGGGATLGELPNSFVKRQLGIPPGASAWGWQALLFYVWDQVDLLIPTWPLLLVWIRPGWHLVLMSFALALIVHQCVSVVGYLIGARRTAR
jgi:CDP-2,3-bis-(O-geranylgeranyl)-sn-glycerol synthase